MPDWSAATAFASIVLGITIYSTSKALFTHRERMAKIAKGIDPGEEPFSGIKFQSKKGANPDEPTH